MSMKNRIFKTERRRYYAAYTGLYCILAVLVFFAFLFYRKSFIWKPDGMDQHYNVIAYYGEYLREWGKNLLHGNFSIKEFDFSIGYGADVLSTLNYYAIGDPLTLLSAFMPKSGTEYLYNALILLRLYLAGVAFSCYCRKRGQKNYATLIGSIVYVFSGLSLYSAVRHPYFINPMIYLPIMLLGIEKIFKKERPYVFIVINTVAACSNFYFFYMLCILMFLYAAFRFFYYVKKNYVKQFFMLIGRFLGYYAISLLLSAVIFLPVLYGFFTGGRGALVEGIQLFYRGAYYKKFMAAFITKIGLGSWTQLGFCVIAVYAIVILFLQKKKRPLQIGFVTLTVMLLIPFAGKLMNGMAYVSNRWSFGYSMLVAYIIVDGMERLLTLAKKEKIACTVTSGLFVLYVLAVPMVRIKESFVAVGWMVLLLAALIIVKGERKRKFAVLILCAGNMVLNGLFMYCAGEDQYINRFIKSGQALNVLSESPAGAVATLNDTSFYRFDVNSQGEGRLTNTELQFGLSRTGYYYSIVDGFVTEYLQENNHNNVFAHRSNSLNERVMLQALASTKYYVTKKGMEQYVPFGYELRESVAFPESMKEYQVFENKYALPLGYTYDSYITRETYDTLPAEQKSQALLQSVLLEEESQHVQEGMLSFSEEELPYQMKYKKKRIVVKENEIIVKKSNAKLILEIPERSNGELYLKLTDLWYEHATNPELERFTASEIRVKSGKVTSSFTYRTPRNQFYFGGHDYYLSLNSSKKGRKRIEISFKNPGTYRFSEMKVFFQPLEQYTKEVQNLSKEVLEDVVMEEDAITGSITVSKDKVLCLSVPYSKGWTAYVDGRETPLLRSNTMYMGVELEAGAHEIALVYHTPLLKEGAAVSFFGLILLLAVIYFTEQKSLSHHLR